MSVRQVRRAVLMALPVVALPLLVGCSGSVSVGTGGDSSATSGTIDEQKVADAINANVTKSVGVGVPVTVTCPANISLKAGGTFQCTGEVAGQPLTVDVKQKDDQGNVDFEAEQSLIELTKAQDAISADLTKKAKVAVTTSCPGPGGATWFVGKAGATFTCTATAGSESIKAIVTVKDNNGNITWKYQQ